MTSSKLRNSSVARRMKRAARSNASVRSRNRPNGSGNQNNNANNRSGAGTRKFNEGANRRTSGTMSSVVLMKNKDDGPNCNAGKTKRIGSVNGNAGRLTSKDELSNSNANSINSAGRTKNSGDSTISNVRSRDARVSFSVAKMTSNAERWNNNARPNSNRTMSKGGNWKNGAGMKIVGGRTARDVAIRIVIGEQMEIQQMEIGLPAEPGPIANVKTGAVGKRTHGGNVRTTGVIAKPSVSVGGVNASDNYRTSAARATGAFTKVTGSGCDAIATACEASIT